MGGKGGRGQPGRASVDLCDNAVSREGRAAGGPKASSGHSSRCWRRVLRHRTPAAAPTAVPKEPRPAQHVLPAHWGLPWHLFVLKTCMTRPFSFLKVIFTPLYNIYMHVCVCTYIYTLQYTYFTRQRNLPRPKCRQQLGPDHGRSQEAGTQSASPV